MCLKHVVGTSVTVGGKPYTVEDYIRNVEFYWSSKDALKAALNIIGIEKVGCGDSA